MEMKPVSGEAVELAARLLRENDISGPVLEVRQFQDIALGKTYEAYRVQTAGGSWVMKRGRQEWERYQTLFAGGGVPVPAVLPKLVADGENGWFLMEYLEGPDLRWAEPETMERAAEALADLETAYWQMSAEQEKLERYCGFYRKLPGRFGQYPALQRELETLAQRMETCPRTLIHDDLLPINVLCTGQGIRFIDWSYGGSYPYMMDVCRLFAHVGRYLTEEASRAGFRRYQERLLRQVEGLTPQRLQEDIRLGVIGELTVCLPREPEDQWSRQDRQMYARLLSLCW